MSLAWSAMNRSLLSAFGEPVDVFDGDEKLRTIAAIVDREPYATLPETPEAMRPLMHVFVANDQTEGIDAAELDTSRHFLEFPERVGGAQKRRFAIRRILAQDDGMLQLEVR